MPWWVTSGGLKWYIQQKRERERGGGGAVMGEEWKEAAALVESGGRVSIE